MKKILFISAIAVILSAFPFYKADAQTAEIFELTDSNFKDGIKSGYVLVDFWAPWCPPCRKLAPILDELAVEFSGKVKFAKLNVDNAPAMSQEYMIKSLPTLILFKDGKVKKGWMGFRTKDDLSTLINAEIK